MARQYQQEIAWVQKSHLIRQLRFDLFFEATQKERPQNAMQLQDDELCLFLIELKLLACTRKGRVKPLHGKEMKERVGK